MIDWYYDDLPGPAFSQSLHALREQGEVVAATALGGAMPIYYILGHNALTQALKDKEQFPPGHAYQIISLPFIGETFMSMNEEAHRVWRPPMTSSVRRSAVADMDDERMAAMGHDILNEIEQESVVDLVPAFTRRYAFRVICDLLGLPIELESDYYQWSMDIMFGGRDRVKSQAADKKLTAMVLPILAARRQQPRNDQISRWLHTSVDGQAISDEKILAHIRLFFTAGATTTSDAIGNLLYALLTHPQSWQQCVEQPDCQHNAIQELLRWNPPVAAQPRFARPDADVELAGVNIPANSAVLFGIAAANRDPNIFPEPDRFDINRNTKTLLTFGPGLRTCPGMHLALKNISNALKIVCERMPTLRLIEASASAPRGILLRGTPTLPVSW